MLIYNLIHLIHSLYLSTYQMNLITDLIKNNKMNENERKKINNILFQSYNKFALKKAVDFKKFHYFKCKNIDKNDLILNSHIALFKAIEKYNGNSSFTKFAELYINYALYKVVTNHFSSSIIPKHIRVKSKPNLTKEEKTEYKRLLNINSITFSQDWQFDKNNAYKQNDGVIDKINTQQEVVDFWKKMEILDATSKRIISLKYDIDFKKIRSNKEVSILMGYSEETIRMNLKKSFKLLKKYHFS